MKGEKQEPDLGLNPQICAKAVEEGLAEPSNDADQIAADIAKSASEKLVEKSVQPGDILQAEAATLGFDQVIEDVALEQQSAQSRGSSEVENSKPIRKLVRFDGPKDPENPKNWTMKRKWVVVMTMSCFTFISPISSSIIAPATEVIAAEFNIDSKVQTELMMSIFLLAFAFGPLILGPLSEVYGRVIVLQLANMVYLIFNTMCGISTSGAQICVFRFLSGLGGSASLAIGGGVLGDCFIPEERGKSVAIYSLMPLLGPAIAPIAGGFITENTTWRWMFYATSIADALIQLAGLAFLRETYAPEILRRKAKRLRQTTGDSDYWTENDLDQSTFTILKGALVRPFKLLTTQPIVQFLSLYMAYIYGLMYVMLSSFPTLWSSPDYYDERLGIACLNYISLGVGYWGGAQLLSFLNDRVYRMLKARNNNIGRPEFRVPLLALSAILSPIGLFIYGWTAEYRVHWIAPNIGAMIFAIGNIAAFQCMQTYIVDAYTRYAASALAAASFLRSTTGFAFPLFTPYVYQRLHYGWGNSMLGFIAIAIGIPIPLILWRYGEHLRRLSTYAAG